MSTDSFFVKVSDGRRLGPFDKETAEAVARYSEGKIEAGGDPDRYAWIGGVDDDLMWIIREAIIRFSEVLDGETNPRMREEVDALAHELGVTV